MNPNPPLAASLPLHTTKVPIPYERFGFCWGAVLAGLATAIGLDVLFAELGLAMNLGIIDRHADAGAIATANGLAWVVTGLVALFAGAWIAGRMASTRTQAEGGLHGLAVWGAGALLMLLLAFTSAGVVGGGMLNLVGKGVDGAGALAQVAKPDWDAIRGELDGAVGARTTSGRSASAGAQTPIGEGAVGRSGAPNDLADRSRLFDIADRHFAVDAQALAPGERDEMVQLLAAQTGMSKDVAERTLKQWDSVWARSVQTYETAKQEALDAAEKARRMAMVAAAWAAVAMILGAATAMFGGAYGTQCRLRTLEREHLLLESSTNLRRAQTLEDAPPRVIPQPLH